MLRKPTPIPTFLTPFTRKLHTKSSHRHTHKNHVDNGDNDQRIYNSNESQQDKIQFHKSKGQHILANPRVLDSIVKKSNINPDDTVLEIGPGTGNLTLKLLEASRKVVAIEIDERMVNFLNKRVATSGFQDRLTVIRNDALKMEFPQFNIVVANIPYGISSPLVVKLVYGGNWFRSATLLLQKEFARRLLANPGESEFNRLAVNVKLVADVEFVMDVNKRDFVPPPKVDSSVVIIRPKAQIPEVNLDEWWGFTRTCFGKKNRTLGAMFKQKKKVMELLRLSKKKMGMNWENIVNVDGSDCSEDNDGDDDHDENDDVCYSSSCSETEMSLFKRKIVEVLKSSGFEDKRPSKLCNEELLRLLSVMPIFWFGPTSNSTRPFNLNRAKAQKAQRRNQQLQAQLARPSRPRELATVLQHVTCQCFQPEEPARSRQSRARELALTSRSPHLLSSIHLADQKVHL